MTERLFPLDEARKKAPKPVRAVRGYEHLFRITYGTMHAYVRAHDTDDALAQWIYKGRHPGWMAAQLQDDARVDLVTQAELDAMAETDPKLLNKLRSL